MRTRRWIGAAMLVGATLGAPSMAWADGGAYLDLDRTHYLPGQTARADHRSSRRETSRAMPKV